MPPAPAPNPAYKVALIAPPGMHCTSPPLALAVLQAQAARSGVPCLVRLFDLNLAHYTQALDWLGQGRLPLSIPGKDMDRFASASRRAVDFMRRPGREGRFRDPAEYAAGLADYLTFIDLVNALFDRNSRLYLAGAAAPAWVGEYYRELMRPLLDYAPDMAGISILLMRQLWPGMVMGRALKKAGARVILGGATLSAKPRPQVLLAPSIPVPVDEGNKSIDPGGCLDYLVVGEGEQALSRLLRHPDGDPAQVPGLVYRHKDQVRGNPTQMERDLDSLAPPDFSGLPLEEYHSPEPVLPYLSSRGCFWGRCAFCTHHKTYLAYREESVARTAANLARLAEKHGCRFFTFADEMIHPNRFRRLAGAVNQAAPELEYLAYAKPTGGFTGPVMKALAESGLRVMQWGVESGSQRMLDRMKKGLRLKQVESVLAASHGAGVWNMVFLIFGFPGETEEEWNQTLQMVERNREYIDAVAGSRFILPEGCDVFNNPARYGVTAIDQRATGIPITMAYDYQVAEGITQAQAKKMIEATREKLAGYGRAKDLFRLRDHLLLLASQEEAKDTA